MMWTALIAALLIGKGEMTGPAALREAAERSVHDEYVFHAGELSPGFADFAERPRFGQRGSRRWQIHGGFGADLKRSHNRLGLAGLGVSYFIIDNVSLDAELNGLYVNQRGGDAFAGNLNLLFRWHFLAQDTWSLYGEAGAGMLLATKRVPHDGTQFNFTPQVGFGVSFDLGEDTRLMSGLRWHHISNASLYTDNPGRDSILAYIGVSFGF